MTNNEALERITPQPVPGLPFNVPTCGECGGWGLNTIIVVHHHTCPVAAAIKDWTAITANDNHWEWLGHEPYRGPNNDQ